METTSKIREIEAIDATLRALSRQRAQLAHTLCHQLLAFDDLGGPAILGFTSAREYAEHALGLTARESRECLRVGRRLQVLPRLDAALEAGQLSWSAARALTRVVVPETEEQWVRQAQTCAMRELEAAISVSSAGDFPPDPDSRPVAPAVTRFVFEIDSTDGKIVADALALRRAALGGDLDVADIFVDLCRTVLVSAAAAPPAVSAAHTPASPITSERFQLVLQKCPTCERVVHVGHSPVSHAVSRAVAAQAECDAVVVDEDRGGRATRTIPPTVRRRVAQRDGHRCVVPGCGARLWLDVHHLVPRAESGQHDDENLTIICPAHHRRVHEGTLHLSRGANGEVVVRRGEASTVPLCGPTPPSHVASTAVSASLAAAIDGCGAEFGWVVPELVAHRLASPCQPDTLALAIATLAAARGWPRDDGGWYRYG